MASNGDSVPKSAICDQKGINLIIEDSLANAYDCVNGKRIVYLMNKPWNAGEMHDGIIRVDGWKDIIKKLDV